MKGKQNFFEAILSEDLGFRSGGQLFQAKAGTRIKVNPMTGDAYVNGRPTVLDEYCYEFVGQRSQLSLIKGRAG